MSKLIATSELNPQDVFELEPNGSVYIVATVKSEGSVPHMRLWCIHEPDALTSSPPLIPFKEGQMVRRLDMEEVKTHYPHPGYVQTVFRAEMDRRNAGQMQTAMAKMHQKNAEQVVHDRADRPWWKKMFR